MIHTWVSWVCSEGFLWGWIGLAVVVFVVLTQISAPYGRHGRGGWGPAIPAAWGWFVMEVVTLLGFGLCFWFAETKGWEAIVFLILYAGHYVYRACIYPWLSPPGATAIPVSVVAMATTFNIINSTVLGGALFVLDGAAAVPASRLIAGLGLFLFGFVTHVRSDAILRRLRRENGPGYHIPSGFLYRWVSCPNYLGEMVQWFGFAVAIHSLAGWSFAVWTVANLLPRALRHHQWYRERFEDYPKERRAVLPLIL